VALQFEFTDDRRQQRPRRVRERRTAKARMKLLRDGRAADHLAAFEDNGPQARPRQIARGDKSVVPAADDDNFVSQVGYHEKVISDE
jgi:hypothetical protein